MEVSLEVYMNSKGGRFMRKSSFSVKLSDYKKNPDEAAAIAAYEWIQRIKEEHIEFTVEKVMYNGEHDITRIVKQLKPVFPDNLPF
ncbi:hypothetical protein BIV59_10725 [Bacillus sp. MUM 13]|nr:hypothetical protein BIV59_10725 [Bacillus sp. MUM 13]